MVAINFSERFAGPVERGEKCQTIRRTAKCKPGDKLQIYTGQRTKNCRKLLDAVCKGVAKVKITRGTLEISGHVFMSDTAAAFARADGFSTFDEMFRWFSDRYDTQVFEGYVITWDSVRQGEG